MAESAIINSNAVLRKASLHSRSGRNPISHHRGWVFCEVRDDIQSTSSDTLSALPSAAFQCTSVEVCEAEPFCSESPCHPRPILPRNFKILKSSSKRHATYLSEQLTVKYHIQRSDFSAQQQLLFTGTSSCSAPTTTPQNPAELPPTHPLPLTMAADHLIPRTEIIQHHQLTISGDYASFGGHGLTKLVASKQLNSTTQQI
ncbi:hypothetical protein AVEN_138696-1 [Araneus ventricosus]|uniref:Uncharacterized protein n=1 Tax=Araneus ventricosus TaxID=182803 RepID=A0A4Y2R3Q9_ARAVE|nr:hypothetical protein AVEN_138696-1 [Araneus ventricosus]